jgi:hypothetical protein
MLSLPALGNLKLKFIEAGLGSERLGLPVTLQQFVVTIL